VADITMEYTNKELVAFWVSLSLTLRGQHIPLHGTKISLCDFSWAANTRLRQGASDPVTSQAKTINPVIQNC